MQVDVLQIFTIKVVIIKHSSLTKYATHHPLYRNKINFAIKLDFYKHDRINAIYRQFS